MSDSLGAVLEAGRWEKALFTTYSLSLTFFESIILRALRKAECSEIWVITDAEGYRSSLMERGSVGVGHDYHLVPVGLRNGIFHPKCCYLIGADGDLLVIGSGNLTFGGFGRNLEAIEVLSSTTHPECFSTFATFLAGLEARPDLICPDFAWANSFAKRAREVGAGNPSGAEYPQLLTTLEQPIKDQLAAIISSCGEVEDLTILSPFFGSTGQAVLELARETGAPEVRIALPPGNELSTFPFPETLDWPVKVSAVTLDSTQANRKLHAKWMEWNTAAGVLTLTGSINATRQALCNTNNIEVGVLRLASKGNGWATWSRALTPSSYKVMPFRSAGLSNSDLVFTELLDNGELRGTVVSATSPAGRWSGTIEKQNGDSLALEVSVDVNGHFSHPSLSIPEDFLFANGLQIRLESERRIARGWITNITVLSLPKAQRVSASTLLRLINRAETEDDNIALLELFATHALDHLKTFQRQVTTLRSLPEDSEGETDTYSIDLEYLKPNADPVGSDIVTQDRMISAIPPLDRIFAQLRKRLLGLPGRERPGHPFVSPNDDSEEEAIESDTSKAPASHQKFENTLDHFMESMEHLVQTASLAEEQRRPLLVLWLEVTLHMLVRRKRDLAGAVTFLRNWFRKATLLASITEHRDSLAQHVVTAAAILAAVDLTSPSLRLHLHEALEHYWRGEVNRERAIADLLPPSPLTIAALFLETSELSLKESLVGVLNTTTRRHELEQVLLHAQPDDVQLETSVLFQSEGGRELRDQIRLRGKVPQMELLRGDLFICPRQFIRLSEACRGELQKNRIAHCSVCGSLIVRMAP